MFHDQTTILAAAPSLADGPDNSVSNSGPTDRGGQFVAVTGPDAEQVNASTMVVLAYGLFWLLAFAFVALTYRNQSRLAKRVAELESKMPKDASLP